MPSDNVTEALDGLTTAFGNIGLLALLAFIAVILTVVLFAAKQPLLGFPSAIFWALFGADCYILRATATDIYSIMGFASFLGMVTFCAFGAFAVREKRDSIGDVELEHGDGPLFDEVKKDNVFKDKDVVGESKRSQKLHARANNRRSSGPMEDE